VTRAKTAAAGAVVVLVAVVVLAITSGTPTVTGTPVAMPVNPVVAARDGSVAAASTAAVALSSLDARDPEGTVDRMEQIATGSLLDELRANRVQRIAQIRQAAVLTTAEVLTAAASAVDPGAGKATVLVLVKVTTTGPPPPRQLRVVLEMTRTPQGWKAAAVSSPPVG
jgi:Mce-associated membrane protein